MDMLGLAVKGLDRTEALMPALATLGRRHAGYGVKERDYETVGEALLWTLEQGLGPSFTPEVKEAWTALYRLVADTMRAACTPARDKDVKEKASGVAKGV
jgi:hemoglobin-like flavoprotein